MWTKTFIDDYENPWRLDVLGVTYIARDHIAIHQDFKDQLKRSKDGWYETGLMWKYNSTALQQQIG